MDKLKINMELNQKMYLSEHFSLAEMTVTNVKNAVNNPGPEEIENLKRLCGCPNERGEGECLYLGSTWTATWVSGP